VHCRLTLHVQRRRRLRGRPLGVKPLAHVPAARARAAVRLGKAAGFGRGSSLDRAAAWASRGQGGRASWQRAELGGAGLGWAGRGWAGLTGSRCVSTWPAGTGTGPRRWTCPGRTRRLGGGAREVFGR
jgi:hypothetical protein